MIEWPHRLASLFFADSPSSNLSYGARGSSSETSASTTQPQRRSSSEAPGFLAKDQNLSADWKNCGWAWPRKPKTSLTKS